MPKLIQDQVKGIKPLQPYPGRKEDSKNFVLRTKEEIWTKYDTLDVMNLGIIKWIVLIWKGQEEKGRSPCHRYNGRT